MTMHHENFAYHYLMRLIFIIVLFSLATVLLLKTMSLFL